MPLPRLRRAQRVWIENTKTEHEHGGPGWEFGECLWSPSRARPNGTTDHQADRYRSMRHVTAGDVILHFLEHSWTKNREVALCGFSFAAGPYKESVTPPPIPGDWANRPKYYRIALEGFTAIDPVLLVADFKAKYRSEILSEKKAGTPENYPFALYSGESLRLTQGNYLATCTRNLYSLLRQELTKISPRKSESSGSPSQKLEYEEGQRRSREVTFFSRNRALALAVKSAANYRCAVCELHFPEQYDGLGSQFIECHHLDPLSDRPGNDSASYLTSINRCVALCSNCHSMVHQRRPPLEIAELKARLKRRSQH